MDVVLGVSMAPAAVRIALVEGEDAEGLIVEEDGFSLARDAAAMSASDQVISAILGTREGAADAGLRLSSIGVSWTDQIQAAALRDALAARKVENVMLVSAFLAAVALGQAVGGAVGYERTGVLFIEPDSATLAVVNTADGSLCDVRRQSLADDDDTAVAELAEMVSGVETMDDRPDGIYVVGSGIDVPLIKPALEAATSLTVSVSEEPDMALARGAALASGHSPLFAATTAAFAYAQDPADSDPADSDESDDEYESDAPHESAKRRPAFLVGSALAVVAIVAVVALEVALAISIRPTVALQPTPSQNHFLALLPKAPAPVEAAAPQPKLNLPGPAVAPRAIAPQLPEQAPVAIPAPEAPALPVPALPAPRLPEPIAVPPRIPILAPPVEIPGPGSLVRPPVVQAPVQVPRQQPQLPVPEAPVIQSPPGRGPSPNPGRGPFGQGPGRGGPGGGDIPGVGPGGPGGRGPFGGGPFGGDGPGAHGPFGGGGPGAQGPFGGGPGPGGGGFPGGHGPFGGNGPGGGGGGRGPFGGGGPGFGGGGGPGFGGGGGFGGGHGPFGGGGPGGGFGGGGRGHGGFGGGGGGGGHGRH